jgi:RNA polymerase sigma-70 factor (ECF subfamily)
MTFADSADHIDRLFRAAYALCGTRADAEDLVEHTFTRALEHRRLTRRGDDLAHLIRVLRDTWVDLGLERSPNQAADGPGADVEWVVDQSANPGVLAPEVRMAYGALQRLSPPVREAVVAVDVAGLRYRDAARALRIRRGTLMTRLSCGRERIATALDGAKCTPMH